MPPPAPLKKKSPYVSTSSPSSASLPFVLIVAGASECISTVHDTVRQKNPPPPSFCSSKVLLLLPLLLTALCGSRTWMRDKQPSKMHVNMHRSNWTPWKFLRERYAKYSCLTPHWEKKVTRQPVMLGNDKLRGPSRLWSRDECASVRGRPLRY